MAKQLDSVSLFRYHPTYRDERPFSHSEVAEVVSEAEQIMTRLIAIGTAAKRLNGLL